MNSSVRTRFAPSPTGFVHLGNIRSALYPWAFARHHGGTFILRIEDTDTERSTQAATDAILQAMQWLGLDFDEGPYYQSQRLPRYREVLSQLLASGHAYHCYTTQAELDAERERQLTAKQKPRYDGRWRPEPGKTLPPVPVGVPAVVRFKTPQHGSVSWTDAVKGEVSFDNAELDDLVIARADGSPTYNFCVCVDDMDMRITHVIRGDDHVNNTPRQIHIFEALGYPIPRFAHLPTVLNEQGEKLSKRHGAQSVIAYRDQGFLADALVNYLARLGWSHGNDEVFSRAQLVSWFDLQHLGSAAAQFDAAKLRWLNAHYLHAMPPAALTALLRDWFAQTQRSAPELVADSLLPQTPELEAVVALLQERCHTLLELVQMAQMIYVPPPLSLLDAAAKAQWLTPAITPVLQELRQTLAGLAANWSRGAIHEVMQAALKRHALKMPQLAMPLRLLVSGRTQTPSVDAVLELTGCEQVLARLDAYLHSQAERAA